MSKRSFAIGNSVSAKTQTQWRFLLGLWSITGVVGLLAPWNIGLAAALFAAFLHLAATE